MRDHSFGGRHSDIELHHHTNTVTCSKWHPTMHHYVLTGSADGKVILSDLRYSNLITARQGHGIMLNDLSSSLALNLGLQIAIDNGCQDIDIRGHSCAPNRLILSGMTTFLACMTDLRETTYMVS